MLVSGRAEQLVFGMCKSVRLRVPIIITADSQLCNRKYKLQTRQFHCLIILPQESGLLCDGFVLVFSGSQCATLSQLSPLARFEILQLGVDVEHK